jgi:hypothetical protein
MAVYEALLLNTVVPQIQAAQAGDSYVMVVNATTPALRITQTGTGDSILVEDSSNPDATPFVVTAAGDVGIGTNAPTSKLEVVGAIKATAAGASVIAVEGSAQGYGIVQIQATSAGGKNWSLVSNATGSALGAAGSLSFRDSSVGTTHMTLDSSGNLGLGVTPSAWVDRTALEGSYGGALSFDKVYLQTALSSNCNYNGTNWLYKLSGWGATRYELGDISNGSAFHKWYTAPSGTANDPVSFTQAMTLDASGNLGVGTTSALSRIDARAASATMGNYQTIQAFSTDTSAAIDLGGGISLGGFYNSTQIAQYASIVGRKANGTAGNYDGYLAFGTNAQATGVVERARITSGGDLLVGSATTATNSSAGFKVLGSLVSGHWDPTVVTDSNSASASCWDIYSTATGSYRFYVTTTGVISAVNTTISAISDVRFKENIQDLDVGLDKIMALKPRKFDWKEGKGKNIKGDRGWIAQEFEQVFPDMIDTWRDPAPEGEEPYKSVRADLIPVMVKAIQELKAEVDSLKAQLEAK